MAERDGARRVDDVDRKLLALLGADPRASTRKLSRAIGMSPGAVGERLERLQEHGVIRGFSLDVDPSALGFGLEVLVAIELRQGSPVENTIDLLWGIEEVQAIQLVTGRWDLVLTMLVRDQHHLREVLLGAVWSVADFQHSETMIILDRRQRVAVDPAAAADGSVEE
ncbi:Lrp/AsnC family transcriptional regulator for asnA, asnC and gidA [Actinomycetospora succinea]|uniref:Lrp/AsnC family transcriptional regulator for asnA, asnC and gidA n=1 Tax=Actinomycetospora succinea TaxID=663603 RepID=A0A4R6VQN8_9PSEU|nr:Lrp/AsnC family transcriptional regulator [Actinomycetospora succinea]TDQ64817.1 Lrp/AsnC family transcriptional regulator for asnA, asnC and gidA [Actinomycetospora succinea]